MRAIVIGPGGAGKTTLALEMSQRTGVPVIHLDQHYWRRGWIPTPASEWREVVSELTTGDAWIMDGNYGGTLEQRIAAADLVVLVEAPRLLCLWRVVRRRFAYRGRSRPSVAPGCPERLTPEFLWWIWSYPWRRLPGTLERLNALGDTIDFVRLRTQGEIDSFLDSLNRESTP